VSQSSPRPQALEIAGPAGVLEALLEQPANARSDVFGVVCHPHPLGGGTMTNKVVHTLARAMHKQRAATLRFNFRGVGASAGAFDDGRGEVTDALAVIAAGRERFPTARLWLAGFSFGSYVALQAAANTDPAALITVAPPVGRWDFSAIPWPRCPWLIVQGDADELVDAAAVRNWAQAAPKPPSLVLLPGVGHFFHAALHQLDAAATDFFAR
jgi:alpha/beta superfamily hydrolase